MMMNETLIFVVAESQSLLVLRGFTTVVLSAKRKKERKLLLLFGLCLFAHFHNLRRRS
jgi:hypothetical protein